MEKNKKINLSLIHPREIGHVLVEGAFIGKDKQKRVGYFLIDTGAVDNILNSTVASYLGEDAFTGKKLSLIAIDDQGEQGDVVTVPIELDGIRMDDEFSISQTLDFDAHFGDNCIIGLLGTSFLTEYHLAIDLDEQSLRTVNAEPIDLSEKSFFFPMNLGLRTYGSPMVGFMKDNKEYLCIVDTGVTHSLFAENAVAGTLSCEDTGRKGWVTGVSGKEEVSYAHVVFSLFSWGKSSGETKFVEIESMADILSGRKYILDSKRERVSRLYLR